MTMKALIRASWYGAKVIFWLPVILFTIYVVMPIQAIYFVYVKKILPLDDLLEIYAQSIRYGVQRDMLYIRTGMKI